MSAFGTYLIGILVVIVGLAAAAYFLGVATKWIVVGVLVILGLGIVTATSRTKQRDPPPPTA
jgi:hypothetical protein